MNSFNLSTTKNLSELGEDVITLKRITSDSSENLQSILLFVHKKYPNGDTETHPVSTYDSNFLYTKVPEINIDFKIVDCAISTLEIQNPKDKQFQIFYETLSDKLRHLQEKEDKSRTNVKSEVAKWQNSVNALYKNIIEWVAPFNENIKPEIINYSITEEISGQYEIPILAIKPNIGKSITFRPIGTFVIGAEGRIDVNISNFGKSIMLVLHREDSKDNWVMIIDKNIQNKRLFQKPQFINLLYEVIPENDSN